MLGGNFLCDFSLQPNSPHAGTGGDPFVLSDLTGVVSDSGHSWKSSGSAGNIAGVHNGLLVNTDGAGAMGYGYIDLLGRPALQSATLKFGSGSGTVLSSSRVDFNLNTMVHCQMTPTGINFQVRENGGAFISIFSYNYTTDPTQFYTCSIAYNKNTAIITAADGTVHYVTDPRIGRVIGRYLMYQANGTNAQSAGIRLVSATIGGRNMV